MQYYRDYKPIIKEELGVGPNLIRPRNIYKINSYKYLDGKTKSLAGNDTSLVFVIGISPEKIVSGIKINMIKPDIFYRWFKKLFQPGLTEEAIDNSEDLDELLILDNKDGKKIFSQFIRPTAFYRKEPSVYRTYILKNIKSAEEIKIKKEVLKKIYK